MAVFVTQLWPAPEASPHWRYGPYGLLFSNVSQQELQQFVGRGPARGLNLYPKWQRSAAISPSQSVAYYYMTANNRRLALLMGATECRLVTTLYPSVNRALSLVPHPASDDAWPERRNEPEEIREARAQRSAELAEQNATPEMRAILSGRFGDAFRDAGGRVDWYLLRHASQRPAALEAIAHAFIEAHPERFGYSAEAEYEVEVSDIDYAAVERRVVDNMLLNNLNGRPSSVRLLPQHDQIAPRQGAGRVLRNKQPKPKKPAPAPSWQFTEQRPVRKLLKRAPELP